MGALGASGLVSNLSFSSQSVLLWLWSTSFGGVCSHFPWVGLVGTHGCVKVFTFFLHTLLIFCSHELLQLKGFSWLCYSMWFCFSFSVVFTVFLSLEFTLCLGGGFVRIGLFLLFRLSFVQRIHFCLDCCVSIYISLLSMMFEILEPCRVLRLGTSSKSIYVK